MDAFASREEVEAIDDDKAIEVLDFVRELLITQLTAQREHPHLGDDCGDYLMAATENWTTLYDYYFTNDGTGFTDFVKKWLLNPPNRGDYMWGGSDGEARFALVPFLEEDLDYED